ncbi:MAG: SPOR domain-containing protein [Flavobacterium sp.]
MKTDRYIAQLLYRHQCVILPGFGAFLSEIQSSQLNELTNTFYPPTKIISFNPHLKHNDGLLAHHISQNEKIDYESAVELIQTEVETFKNKLKQFEPVLINDVGVIRLNSEGNLFFESYNYINFLTESFGLSSYVSPVIKREILIETKATEQEIPVIDIQSEKNPVFQFMKYAAAIAIGLGTLGFVGNNIYQNKIAEDTRLVQLEVQKEVQNKIQEATFVISNPLPKAAVEVMKADETKIPYHIVAGSFREESNAKKIFNQLTKLGYEAKMLEKTTHNLYPVLYGSYSDYSEAEKQLKKIKENENPEAWLMIKEL